MNTTSELLTKRSSATVLGIPHTTLQDLIARVGFVPARAFVVSGGKRIAVYAPADVRRWGERHVRR